MPRWVAPTLLLFTLAGCTAPPSATPPNAQLVVSVIYAPELQPWADAILACQSEAPGSLAIQEETGSIQFPTDPAQILLRLGDLEESSIPYEASLLGETQLVVIANAQNTAAITALSPPLTRQQLRSIYSGDIVSWAAIADPVQVTASSGSIQVWVYPSESAQQSLFDQAVMNHSPVTSQAYLAPDPQAMLEAIAYNPDAIGYLPEGWLFTSDPTLVGAVFAINLDVDLVQALRQPIIALTVPEPLEELKALLACTQRSDFP
ncbi:MAG: hypothetical protein JW726_08615 [Anaerolineales bacterium]|nr:hypothetical protein [Anaerolineales bacterium]